MTYIFNKITNFHNPNPLFFLCGVKYNEKNPDDDKRVVLKNHLKNKGYYSIILEENFIPGMNGQKLGYKFIELKNLNDVETLACMIVDGIFIIHESHSTASEIALFSSNESVAKKVFVLVPDAEIVEENHFSGFLYFGYKDIIKKPITFYPVIERYIVGENNSKILTYFNKNEIGGYLSQSIDNYIHKISCTQNLNIVKKGYNNRNSSIVYYFSSDSEIVASINVQVLKFYILALFNISDFRSEFKDTTKFFEAVSICEKWFKMVLISTIQANEKSSIMEYNFRFEILNCVNSRLNLRKAISFTFYAFHAIGWISIEPTEDRGISLSKKTEESEGFKAIYSRYSDLINEYELLDFEGFIL